MMTIVKSAMIVFPFALLIAGIWASVWAWRNFHVSVFAWLVGGVIAHKASLFLTIVPDRAKFEAGIRTLHSQTNVGPEELIVYTASITSLFPLLAALGIALIAVGELSHFGDARSAVLRTKRDYESFISLAPCPWVVCCRLLHSSLDYSLLLGPLTFMTFTKLNSTEYFQL